jgi:hypothetical protein
MGSKLAFLSFLPLLKGFILCSTDPNSDLKRKRRRPLLSFWRQVKGATLSDCLHRYRLRFLPTKSIDPTDDVYDTSRELFLGWLGVKPENGLGKSGLLLQLQRPERERERERIEYSAESG